MKNITNSLDQNKSPQGKVLVVGQNFAGLSTAWKLLKKGFEVTMVPSPGDFNLSRSLYREFFIPTELVHEFFYEIEYFPNFNIVNDIHLCFFPNYSKKFSFGVSNFFENNLSIYERLIFLKNIFSLKKMSRSQIMDLDMDKRSELFLLQCGFEPSTVSEIFKPIFGTFIKDPTLSSSRRVLQLIWKNLSEKDLLIPQNSLSVMLDEVREILIKHGLKYFPYPCKQIRKHPMDSENFIMGVQLDSVDFETKFIDTDFCILSCHPMDLASYLNNIAPSSFEASKYFFNSNPFHFYIYKTDKEFNKLCVNSSQEKDTFHYCFGFKHNNENYLQVVSLKPSAQANETKALIMSLIPELNNLEQVEDGFVNHYYFQGENFRVQCPLTTQTDYKNLLIGSNILSDASLEGDIIASEIVSQECSRLKLDFPQFYKRSFVSMIV